MMFSDNVSLEDERSLKEEARDRGLLVMGPDCGTAIIAGAPLAFANQVRRGDIGIIGASGTGTQEVSCLISEAGRGISHAIGVGGRELKREIGGITTLMAIEALEGDPATKHLVLVSKPPHPDVARVVIDRLARGRKPFTVCFLGGSAIELPSHGTFARTLADAAEAAVGGRTGEAKEAWRPASGLPHPPRGARRIEGLFCGGTLCAEAQAILAGGGRKLVSNAPVPGVGSLSAAGAAACDRLIDLGDDEHTRGRPHPMIEPAIRDEALRAALADRSVAVVLLDVVIGFGAHDDPAGHLVEVLGRRNSRGPLVIASVTGTEEDRQVRSRQVACLETAGVLVAPSNAEASRLALAIVRAGR
jgi:succinyl-CoA synthetase alpha subunit